MHLSQGVKEAGIAEGEARGREEGRAEGKAESESKIIVNMYRNGFTLKQISLATGKNAREITAIIERKILWHQARDSVADNIPKRLQGKCNMKGIS